MSNCFHKYYRYMAYSNTLYSYLTSTDGEADKYLDDGELSPEDLIAEMEAMEKEHHDQE